MAPRILLGNHPTLGMGGYVSKPGIDVTTAGKFGMMWSTLLEQLQIAQSGSIIVPGNGNISISWSGGIVWTALGFRPQILLSCDEYEVFFEYTSDNSGRLRRTLSSGEQASNNPGTADRVVYYIVTRTAY